MILHDSYKQFEVEKTSFFMGKTSMNGQSMPGPWAIAITSIRLGWPEPRLSLLLDVLAENICALVGTLKGKFT